MALLCNNFLLSSAASFQRNRILTPTTLKPHSTSRTPITPLRIRPAQLLRVGCNGAASPVVHCADLVEKDWSFIDSAVDESGWDAKCHRIVSAAEVGEKSRLLVSFGASGFIDKIVTECQCETLLVVHDSLFDLAMIKEKYDRVRCWQGSITDLPEKFLPLDVVFVCYFPGMGVSVEDLLASLARSCSPGAIVVICCDQGREIVEQVHKQQHPDIVTSDLPCKTNLEIAAGANSFRLTEFVDDPTFYLAKDPGSSVNLKMVIEAEELIAPLGDLPPVDFCCAYGSSLLPNPKKESMVDYILGVSDPLQWHTENLKRNRGHYASCTAYLGSKPITVVADVIGTGVHFNPFVPWKNKMIKYGVVRMQDLACDILTWNRFYLSGRLQKPVSILVDNLDIRKANKVNLKAAVAAALLLLPSEFSEEELYSAICSLSYMGDLRMIFAEDKHKVKKIVRGSFQSLRTMYKPFLVEFSVEGLLQSSYNVNQKYFKQDRGLSATHSLFYSLPSVIQSETHRPWVGCNAGTVVAPPITIASREEAARQTRRALKRLVMVSSVRQVMSGLLAAGGFNAIRYLRNKMSKAWKSRASSYP